MKSSNGFSLVELMLIIAIIGLLSSIAIPNFQIFQEKARQSEAKMDVSNVGTAEHIFMAEYGAYTSEMDQLGVNFTGAMLYNVGFGGFVPYGGPGAPPHPPGGSCCHTSCWGTVGPPGLAGACDPNYASSAEWTCNQPYGAGDYPFGFISPTSFAVEATGLLNGNGFSDNWTLDDAGNLLNTQSGL